jgi:hypothetical protein
MASVYFIQIRIVSAINSIIHILVIYLNLPIWLIQGGLQVNTVLGKSTNILQNILKTIIIIGSHLKWLG